MKAADIRVNGIYVARVSGKLTKVRVDAKRDKVVYTRGGIAFGGKRTHTRVVYDVTNLSTGRKLTFQSAAKFRGEYKPKPQVMGHAADDGVNYENL